ncbi:MAG: SGNH/GDSL hydrolase family protein [Thermoanaerobaculia bacterium]
MKTKNLLRCTAVAAALLLAIPAGAQQADFTMFVSIGDSLTQAYTDGCVVEYAQRDSFGAVIARGAGAAYELPIISAPGLGPCMYLTSLAPTFGNRPNTGVPTNTTLPRPYNNLGVSGFKIHDVVFTNPTTPAGGIAYITLRGLGTALLQAASLKPTFMTIFIGNNDVLGAATSATVIDGLTLTPMASVNADLDTIFNTLKAAQGGAGKGIVFLIGDVSTIPFITTVPPFLLDKNSKPILNPSTGQPIPPLYNTCPGGIPACPVPAGSYLTLLAASYLQQGIGYPCAVTPVSVNPNCDKPLPDNLTINPSTGVITPGVVLTPTEVAAIRARTSDINTALITKGTAAGYKIYDTAGFFSDMLAHGRSYGGITIGTSFLSGGFFGYDGVHPTSLGYAIFADDVMQAINANYGNNLPRVNMFSYLFNGNTSAGGYPIGAALSPNDQIDWAAAIFAPEDWYSRVRYVFPDLSRKNGTVQPLEGMPISTDPGSPAREREQVN